MSVGCRIILHWVLGGWHCSGLCDMIAGVCHGQHKRDPWVLSLLKEC